MRQFPSHSRQPRRGQALLLAVLIMIFAALLSASFIAIISVNLSQTARQADKNRAASSAKAGVDYVNRQLAFSADGENWRPTLPTANPLFPASYYTPLDVAQGWKTNGYAKFPDPLADQGANNGPQFLTKVERIPFNLTSTSPDFDKAGQLRVTVIGLSPEDPTAYSRSVFYKGGYQNAPIAQNMRVVSNWDFENGVVPVAQCDSVVAYDSSNRVVTLKNIKGKFPDPPFAVMIGDPRTVTSTGMRGAVVVSKTPTTFTFAYPRVSLAVKANERIELAASIGAPNGLNYKNDNGPTAIPAPITTPVKIADNLSPGGLRVNGGFWLTGQASSDALRAPNNAYGATLLPPATIQASGMFARDGNTAVTKFDVRGVSIPTAGDNLVDSDYVSFPGWTPDTGYDRRSRDLLVSDGWNRLFGVPSGRLPSTNEGTNPNSTGTRQVADFVPPAIDRGEGLERYRNLARYSPDGNASGAIYGYGTYGIYIDNAQDKERVSSGTALRDMTQAEMVKMWVSRPVPATAAPDAYMRTGTPALTTANASLEQQHIRGWVGPDEFRGRGVEIELGSNSITVTRDARDDGPANLSGNVLAKTWKDPVTGNGRPGVYTQTFTWPAAGVVFAEGNVRIRGKATNAPRSLTVVSMGNIYIEDSLSADDGTDGVAVGTPRKILLLAAKNVVMNPTRVLGRPDAQTTVTAIAVNTGPPPTQTLTVADGLSFKIGDYVRSFNSITGTPGGSGYVVAPLTATQINLSSVTGIISASDFVRTPSSVPNGTGAGTLVSPYLTYSPISSGIDVIQRRISTQTASTTTNPLRLAFNHGGDRPAATVFTATTNGIPPTTALLSNKRVLTPATSAFNPAATTVSDVDKLIRVDYTGSLAPPANGTDTFPASSPATQTISLVGAAMNAKKHTVTLFGVPTTVWSYTTTVNATYGSLPFFYLAGVGNRMEYGVTSTEYRESIRSTTTYSIPLATSIAVALNGVRPTISNERWNTTANAYDATTQFGFNPTYQDVSAVPATLPEDLLTADRSFYQLEASKSTLDSRTFGAVGAGINPLVLRRSDNLIGLGAANLPAYRTLGIKEENVTQPASSSSIDTIGAGYTFDVNAFVYAQNGSWFVIPNGLFNDRLRGDATQNYLDINGNNTADAGEYIDATPAGYSAGDFADLNRNGLLEDAEKYAMARYSRYNYQINFTGAISEKQTPIVNTMRSGPNTTDPVVANGAVEAWMLSTATATKLAGSTTFTNDRMKYIFDSDYVTGKLENDDGFRLPQTTEIFNVS